MKIIKKTLAIILTILMLASAVPLTTFAAAEEPTAIPTVEEESTATVVDIQVFDVQVARKTSDIYDFEVPDFSYKLIYNDGSTVVKTYAQKDKNLVVYPYTSYNNWNKEGYIDVSYLGVMTTVAVQVLEYNYYYEDVPGGVKIYSMSSDLKGEVEIPSVLEGKPVVSLDDFSGEITHVIIPATVKEINTYYLTDSYYSKKLQKITVANGNPNYSSYDGVLYNKAKTKVLAIPYARTSDVILHEAVKDINNITANKATIKTNSKSKYFYYKGGVIYSKDKTKVIYANKNIKGAYTMPSTVKNISKNAFANCDKLTSVKVSDSVTAITYGAFASCDSLKKVTLPKKVKSIGDKAFMECAIEKISIPNTVTAIGGHAFADCVKLGTLTLGKSLNTIGNSAFSNTAIKTITITDNVKTIKDQAFFGCEKLQKITLGKKLTSIGEHAFEYAAVKEIIIPDSVTNIGKFAFASCGKLEKLSIGAKLKDFTAETFIGCGKLKAVTVSSQNKNLYSDGSAVYRTKGKGLIIYYKQNQTGYVLQKGTTSIDDGAFLVNWAPKSWKTFVIQNCVTGLIYNNFKTCENLTSITIPNKVKEIEMATFAFCPKLVSVTIPKTVTRIESDAFNSKLKHVFYAGTKEQWKKIHISEYGEKLFKNATIHYNSKGCKHKYSKGEDLTCNVCGYFEILPTTRKVNGKTYYYVGGKKNTSFTGVVKIGGKDKFFKKGVLTSNLDSPKVKLTNTKKGVNVSWSKVTAAKKYVVYRSVYSKGKWSKQKLYKTTTSLKFTDKVKSGEKVKYTVYAQNGTIKSKAKAGVTIKLK